MADFKINGKNVVTQSGIAEPALASNVTGGGGLTSLGTVTAGTLGSGVTGSPALNLKNVTGSTLQVVAVHQNTAGTTTIAQSDVVVHGITKDITPKGTNSDFLIHCRWFGEVSDPEDVGFNIQKDGTRVNSFGNDWDHNLAMPSTTYHNDTSSTPEPISFSTFVENTSSVIGQDITFRLVATAYSSRTLYTNRSASGSHENGTSELIIMEIAG